MSSEFSFWEILSDYWDEFEDRSLYEHTWDAYSTFIYSAIVKLYEADLSKSLDFIEVGSRRNWISLDFAVGDTDSTEIILPGVYDIDFDEVISIPALRNGIKVFENEYIDGTDFTCSNGIFEWLVPVRNNQKLWAPYVMVNNKTIYNNFGTLVQEDLGDSTEYLDAVKGMFYSYWNGPAIVNIRNGVNLFFGYPFIKRDGVVTNIDSTIIEVMSGHNDYTYYPIPVGEIARVAEGDVVKKFDSIFNIIDTLDYINSPGWWKTYGIKSINRDYFDAAIDDSIINQINYITKYFTFGVKIDAEKYAGVKALSEGVLSRFMTSIKPAYTDYIFMVVENQGSTSPEDGRGDWINLIDGMANTPSGLEITTEFAANETTSFNNMNYLSLPGYSHNMSYSDYANQDNLSYDIDSDMIILWEEVKFIKER